VGDIVGGIGGEDRTNRDGVCVGLKDGLVVGIDVGVFVGEDVVGLADGALVGAAMFITLIMWFLNFSKLIDPRPVAGSHPGVAWKPSLQHVLDAVHLLSPKVTSFVNRAALSYKIGLMKPTDLPPALNLAAFTRDIIPPKAGALTEVPLLPAIIPPIENMKL
jgi:hypothetical protein